MIKSKTMASLLVALTLVVALPTMASAHCDTMDGPTVADGKKAIESNNINYVLKWVTPENEKEISEIFDLSMKVKDLSPEAKEISQNYFFENLVRLHRTAEGAPFTGLKPSGTAIDEKVLAADKSIEVGNLSTIENLVEKDKVPELKERFEKVMALKDYDVNDVEAGREYIEAYVKYFKFAEGEEEAHGAEATSLEKSHDEAETLPVIPWSLAGVFGLTTLILGIAYHKKACK
ncbi:LysM domain-containing protein [Clostridium butyricum]|uniref:LysM domain-containing protein n=1 Tax=Clostridium butyricum TaxID=1492 RepID=A0A6L9ES07_CLOBU|nr:LysM domain-containing protein [Clostridium butyricum]